MSVAVTLDIFVAGLLVATIAYAIVLNRRLSQLRGGREQMERLINDFYQATTRAESGVTALKEAAGSSDTEIIGQLESLAKLRDELDFLVGRAEAQGDRLEELVRDGRGLTGPAVSGSAKTLAPDAALDAELFGVSEVTAGAGDPGQRPSRPAPASNSAEQKEIR
jgi:hypothetical protein